MLHEIYREACADDHYHEVMLHAAKRLVELEQESRIHPLILRILALRIYDKNSDVGYKRVVSAIEDKEALAEIAQKASYDQVALVAVQRINDQALLADIAKNSLYPEVACKALEQISDHALIVEIGQNAQNEQIARAAVKKALETALNGDDPDRIDSIALSAATGDTFLKAMDKMQNQALKEQAAKSFLEKNRDKLYDPLFETALNYIHDTNYIWQIVCDKDEEYDEQLRAAAVRRITRTSYLEQVILDEHEDFFVRQAALETLHHPTTLCSIILKWLVDRRYNKLFDIALTKLDSRDIRFLSTIVLDDYTWEHRISAWKRILELPQVSLQEKKRIFDRLLVSIASTDKVPRLINTIPQNLLHEFDL